MIRERLVRVVVAFEEPVRGLLNRRLLFKLYFVDWFGIIRGFEGGGGIVQRVDHFQFLEEYKIVVEGEEVVLFHQVHIHAGVVHFTQTNLIPFRRYNGESLELLSLAVRLVLQILLVPLWFINTIALHPEPPKYLLVPLTNLPANIIPTGATDCAPERTGCSRFQCLFEPLP